MENAAEGVGAGDVAPVHSQDDPLRRVGVNKDEHGIEIYVGYELKVKLTWEQVETLQILLDYAVPAAQLVDDPETVRQWLAAYEGTDETT